MLIFIDVPRELHLYDQQIKCKKSLVKCLGHHLSLNLNEIYHINHLMKKANYAFYSVRRSLRKIKNPFNCTY